MAEELKFGNDFITTGCSSDLDRATKLAFAYVRDFAMNESTNLISAKKKDMSEEFSFKIDQEVQKILKESLDRTRNLLSQNMDKLNMLGEELVKKETMDAQEVRTLLNL